MPKMTATKTMTAEELNRIVKEYYEAGDAPVSDVAIAKVTRSKVDGVSRITAVDFDLVIGDDDD